LNILEDGGLKLKEEIYSLTQIKNTKTTFFHLNDVVLVKQQVKKIVSDDVSSNTVRHLLSLY
jgi:hypothetical protein